MGEEVPVAVIPFGLEVTVNPVMGEPLLAGAVKLTVAWLTPAIALTPVGGFGRPAGTKGSDCADGKLLPMTLVAVTVKKYAVPFVNPPTTALVALAAAFTWAASVDVADSKARTVKPVMAEPPLPWGVNDTSASPPARTLFAAALTLVGALGAVAAGAGVAGLVADTCAGWPSATSYADTGVAPLDAADGPPVPTLFVALTVKV